MKRQTLKRAVFIVLLSLITALILGACQAGGDAQTTGGEQVYYSFIDDVGNEVVLKKKPQKVAVLFSSFADVWKTAGGTVSITVGESVERGFAGADVPLVDKGAGKTIDSELLVSYQPDFVICSADLEAQVKAAELLVRSGIPSAVFHVESFEDYLSMLKICTDITGNAQAYTTYGADVAARIKQIKDAVHSKIEQSQQKEILFVRAGSKYSATKAKTAADNFVCACLLYTSRCV